MKNKSKDILFQVSGVAILVAAVLYLFNPIVAAWMMAIGVALFIIVLAKSPYPGKSIRGKRLFNFQIFACMLMAAGAYLMFKQHNEWVILLLIAAVFFIYSAFLLPKVLEKEDKNSDLKN